jgi:chemotaxis protein methyltransferase CheR
MGEEAYSIAIVLAEEGLLERSLIYATDIDPGSLRVGETGTYDLDRLHRFREQHAAGGGRVPLTDHLAVARSRVFLNPQLRRHILFSDHSLATDAAFAEVHLVSCRNVLIYFERALQDRAVGLFRDSLCPRGFLGLGSKETLQFSAFSAAFEPFAADQRIYRLTLAPSLTRRGGVGGALQSGMVSD